jgi:hypothetical protein
MMTETETDSVDWVQLHKYHLKTEIESSHKKAEIESGRKETETDSNLWNIVI